MNQARRIQLHRAGRRSRHLVIAPRHSCLGRKEEDRTQFFLCTNPARSHRVTHVTAAAIEVVRVYYSYIR
jgi:hypothetical protein